MDTNQTNEWQAEHEAWQALKSMRAIKVDRGEDKTTITLFDQAAKVVIDKQHKVLYRLYQHPDRVSPHVNYPNLPYNPQVRVFTLFAKHNDWTDAFRYPYLKVLKAAKDVYDQATKTDITFRDKIMEDIKAECKDDILRGGNPGKAYMKKVARIAKKVANCNFGCSLDRLKRIFGGLLWKELDSEILKITVRAFGVFTNSFEYTLVWQNKEQVEEALRIAPGCLAIWRFLMWRNMPAMQKKPAVVNNNVDSPFTCMLQETGVQVMPVEDFEFRNPDDCYRDTQNLMDGWKQIGVDYAQESLKCDNIVKMVKDYFDENKLSSRGWKYLINMPPNYAKRFSRVAYRFGDLIDFLDLLSSTGERLRFSMIMPMLMDIMQYRRGNDIADRNSLAAMLRSACEAQKKCRNLKNWYNQEFGLVWDWFRQTWPKTDANQRRQGWKWYVREQAEWHEAVVSQKRDALQREFWDSLITAQEIDGYQVVALTSSHDLFDEGKDMHHCVSSYVSQCKLGHSRIFSIRKDDKKIATVELYNFVGLDNVFKKCHTIDTTWRVNQVRGVCNQAVDASVTVVANEVARRYNVAENKEQPDANVG